MNKLAAKLRDRVQTLLGRVVPSTRGVLGLQEVIDALPVLVAFVDAQQRYVFVNKRYEAWFGRSVAELRGRYIWEVVGEEAYEQLRPSILRVLGGEEFSVIRTVRYREAGLRDVQVSYKPFVGSDGKIEGYFALIDDVSAQQRAEQRARDFLEGISEAYSSFDHLWRYTYVNDAAVRCMGKQRSELIGRVLWDVYPELRGGLLEKRFLEAVRTGVPCVFETGLADGKLLQVSAYPTADGLWSYVRDITQQRHAEERERFVLAMQAALRELEDPEQIFARAAAMLGEHLRTDRCLYVEVEPDENNFTVASCHVRGVAPLKGRYELTDFGEHVRETLRAGRTLVIEDRASIEPSVRSAFEAVDVSASVAVPLHKSNRLVAVMAVHQVRPRQWNDDEIELVKLVASRCWESIERARVSRDLAESERRFRLMADNMTQLAWMARPDGHVFWYNRRWYEYTGTTPAEMEGWGWQSVHDPAWLPRVVEKWRASIAGGVRFDMEFPLRGADGQFRMFLTRVEPMPGPDGGVAIWFGTNTDIEQQHRESDQLRASERQFRRLADAAPVLIWVADTTRACTWFNQPWLAFTGKSMSEEVGFGWTRNIHPDDYDRCLATYNASFEARRTFEMDYRLRRFDGQYRWVVDRGTPIWGPAGEFTGYMGGCFDITERKDSAEQRERLLAAERNAREYAEHVSRMKDEFLATLSHELRTPLNAIVGWAQLLSTGNPTTEEIAEGIGVIRRNARAQTQLIEDLLDMSRIISGRMRLDVHETRLGPVIEAAIESVGPSAQAKQIRLICDIDPDAGMVSADASRMQQVIWNLLSNAIKFTGCGGEVRLTLRRVDRDVVLTVSDTGSGIDKAFLPHIFDRFRQADGTITRRHGGLGLGLSIVKHLVELHGGTVAAHSQGPGTGATFTVSLPGRSDQPADPAARLGAVAAAGTTGDRSRSNLRQVRVLVVEDDGDARLLVARILGDQEATVRGVAGADEAMSVIDTFRPDVIVSDIGMPDRDGYDLIASVRRLADPQLAATPALALTAFARPDDRRRALAAGYQMHIAKPIDAEELIVAVANLADRARTPAGLDAARAIAAKDVDTAADAREVDTSSRHPAPATLPANAATPHGHAQDDIDQPAPGAPSRSPSADQWSI